MSSIHYATNEARAFFRIRSALCSIAHDFIPLPPSPSCWRCFHFMLCLPRQAPLFHYQCCHHCCSFGFTSSPDCSMFLCSPPNELNRHGLLWIILLSASALLGSSCVLQLLTLFGLSWLQNLLRNRWSSLGSYRRNNCSLKTDPRERL